MTTEQFKKERPEYAHLEGNDLWDAMEVCKLREQQGEAILQQLKPFWKRYKLRHLFYIKTAQSIFSTRESASTRCKNCKRGVDGCIWWGGINVCFRCGKELVTEPNTNIAHRWYIFRKGLLSLIKNLLSLLHIAKFSSGGRYDMFEDESYFVLRTKYNLNWEVVGRELRHRKWWEYLFIKR